ncbi:MAG: hypothetical protein L0323_24250 [Planctomycetes bacterium]|nr:hypothetical protein [Planctomycetota bacterium]
MRSEGAPLLLWVALLPSCFVRPPQPSFRDELELSRFFLRDAERLRGLSLGWPPVIRRVSSEEMRASFADSFARNNPPEDLDRASKSLVAFGLLRRGINLSRAYGEKLGASVAGKYDLESKTLLVREEASDDADSLDTLVHEYVHALDDAVFDLSRLKERQRREVSDAPRSLVEGSATATTLDFIPAILFFADSVGEPLGALGSWGHSFGLQEWAERLEGIESETEKARLEQVPVALRQLWIFPYAHGLAFVDELRRRYGTAALDRAFADPPTTSEQVLHPEKYFERRENPFEVRVVSEEVAGFREAARGSLGEFGIRLVLNEFVNRYAAERAASGWEGDGYRVLEANDGALGLLWHSEWESAWGAWEFEEELTDAWQERYDAEEVEEGDAAFLRHPGGLVTRIERSGRRVLVADGFPEAEAKRLIESMARGDEVRTPGGRESASIFRGAASVLRPVVDFESFDHSTRASLLSSVAAEFETGEYGWETSLLWGGLLRIRSDGDRTSVSTLFGLLSFERNHRASMTSAYAGPFLAYGSSPGTHSFSLPLGILGHASGPGGWTWETGLVNVWEERMLKETAGGGFEKTGEPTRRASLLFGLVHIPLP